MNKAAATQLCIRRLRLSTVLWTASVGWNEVLWTASVGWNEVLWTASVSLSRVVYLQSCGQLQSAGTRPCW